MKDTTKTRNPMKEGFSAIPHAEPLTPYRKSLLNRVHYAASKLGLEGDGYRLALLALSGSRTAIALTNAQIVEAIIAFENLIPQDNTAATLERELGLGRAAWPIY